MSELDPKPQVIKDDQLTNGYIYLLETTSRMGIKDPLREVHPTPSIAYERMIEHAGQEPPCEQPDWPDSFGSNVWGWKPADGSVAYVISEWEWSGDYEDIKTESGEEDD